MLCCYVVLCTTGRRRGCAAVAFLARSSPIGRNSADGSLQPYGRCERHATKPHESTASPKESHPPPSARAIQLLLATRPPYACRAERRDTTTRAEQQQASDWEGNRAALHTNARENMLARVFVNAPNDENLQFPNLSCRVPRPPDRRMHIQEESRW